MLKLFCLGLFIFILYASCQDWEDVSCEVPNDCTDAPSGYSYCRLGKCRQCDPTLKHKDCQCPLNQYCISDTSNNNVCKTQN